MMTKGGNTRDTFGMTPGGDMMYGEGLAETSQSMNEHH